MQNLMLPTQPATKQYLTAKENTLINTIATFSNVSLMIHTPIYKATVIIMECMVYSEKYEPHNYLSISYHILCTTLQNCVPL